MNISVYITCFNKVKFIEKAIKSVLDQSLPADEIIVVDDNSTDGSKELIKSIANDYPGKIAPIFNQSNLGISKCRNIAMEKLKGQYVTFLDGDDYYLPHKLEKEYHILTNNSLLDAVYSNFINISEDGNQTGVFSSESDNPANGEILINTFKRKYNVSSGNNYIYEMMKVKSARTIGLYDTSLLIWEDWDFRIRFASKFHYGYNPQISSTYRRTNNSLSRSNPKIHYQYQWRIVEKNMPILSELCKDDQRGIRYSLQKKLENILRYGLKYYSEKRQFGKFIFCILKLLIKYGFKRNLSFIINKRYLGLTA